MQAILIIYVKATGDATIIVNTITLGSGLY